MTHFAQILTNKMIFSVFRLRMSPPFKYHLPWLSSSQSQTMIHVCDILFQQKKPFYRVINKTYNTYCLCINIFLCVFLFLCVFYSMHVNSLSLQCRFWRICDVQDSCCSSRSVSTRRMPEDVCVSEKLGEHVQVCVCDSTGADWSWQAGDVVLHDVKCARVVLLPVLTHKHTHGESWSLVALFCLCTVYSIVNFVVRFPQ